VSSGILVCIPPKPTTHSDERGQHRIPSQIFMIIQNFIFHGDRKDSLVEKPLGGMFNLPTILFQRELVLPKKIFYSDFTQDFPPLRRLVSHFATADSSRSLFRRAKNR
jgi:hypothetical protein